MTMPGRFADHILPDKIHILNVSFIMQTFRKEFGGTGGNIAYSLALHKIPTVLAGTAGKDFREYRKHLQCFNNLNLKVSEKKDDISASGFVITDKNDNQIWAYYQGAMKYAAEINLEKIFKPGDFLVIAPNDPPAMMKYVRTAVKEKFDYLFDPAFNIPHFSANDLTYAVNNCRILIGNDYEIELICRKLKTNKENLVSGDQLLMTTLGNKGAEIIAAGKVISIPPAKPENVSDPTGAGDAFRAGFLAGFIKDKTLEICGRMGAVTAVYTVEKYGTQTHKFTPVSFGKRYRVNFGQT
jgi:adenosine kinase